MYKRQVCVSACGIYKLSHTVSLLYEYLLSASCLCFHLCKQSVSLTLCGTACNLCLSLCLDLSLLLGNLSLNDYIRLLSCSFEGGTDVYKRQGEANMMSVSFCELATTL